MLQILGFFFYLGLKTTSALIFVHVNMRRTFLTYMDVLCCLNFPPIKQNKTSLFTNKDKWFQGNTMQDSINQ